MRLVVMFCCNRSVLYEQIITILQYAVNFYGSSHITKKRRPCERAPVRHEETNHISCLNQLQELVDEKMVPRCGYGMPAIHLAASQHPSRRLEKRQNIHLTASQKWQKHSSHRLVKGISKRSIEKISIWPKSRQLAGLREPQKTAQLQAFSALPLCHQCHALNVARTKEQIFHSPLYPLPGLYGRISRLILSPSTSSASI